jgi:hypothetical protein
MGKIIDIGIDIGINIVTTLLSAFIIFIISFIRWANTKPKVVISPYIAEGINYSYGKRGKKAYKFKIANHSKFFTASDFDIQLTAVKLVQNKKMKNYTEHIKSIEVKYGGLRILTKRIPDIKLERIRKRIERYTINFAFRIITFEELRKLLNEYNYFRLSIKYKDNLNREFIIEKTFEEKNIIKGEFSNDGLVNKSPS